MTTTQKSRRNHLAQLLSGIFAEAKAPLSYEALESQLQELGLQYNKTSVYRQLDKMLKTGSVTELLTLKGKVWEQKSAQCHAHMNCTNCHSLVCIHLDHQVLQSMKETLQQDTIAQIQFNGTCMRCLNNGIFQKEHSTEL